MILPRVSSLLVAAVLLATGLAVPAVSATALPATARADVQPLPSSTDVDYQLGGAAEPADRVGIVVRDRTDEPSGRYDVCYVNGFQSQPGQRGFWRKRWSLVLREGGSPVVDEAWGEWLLDLRTARKRERLARIVGRWTAGCARDGFDAVEFDNLDSFTRSDGLMKRRHARRYAALLVAGAHDVGLAAGQKNLAGFDGTRVGFDFAVSEECGRYNECDAYTRVYGDQVLAIEYRRRDFEATCAGFGELLPVVLRDRAVTPEGRREWC